MANLKRIDTVFSYIQEKNEASVAELSEMFSVSPETIRRDLEALTAEGKVIRTHGGAVINTPKSGEDVAYLKRAGIALAAKKSIAQKVLPYLANCFTLAFDSSTTTFEAVRLIQDRDDLTVITNSAYAVTAMAQSNLTVVSTGGFLDKHSLAMFGAEAINMLGNYNIDIALIGCKGLSLANGISDSNGNDAAVKQEVIKHSNKTILLADHEKFGRVTFAKIASFDEINMIVTDRDPGPEWTAALRAQGIELVY